MHAGNDGDHARKGVEHVRKERAFPLAAPRADRPVLSGRDRESRHRFAIVFAGTNKSLNGIRAHKVHEMCHAAEHCAFARTDPARAGPERASPQQ